MVLGGMPYEASTQAPEASGLPWPKRTKPVRRCPHCGQCFSKTEHLERHIRSHTKERPFRCAKCGRSYSRQDSLQRHGRTHALDNRVSSPAYLQQSRLSPPEETILAGSLVSDGSTTSADTSNTQQAPTESIQTSTPADGGNFVFPSSILNTPSDLGFMNIGLGAFNASEQPWMIGNDFDLDALNFSFSSANFQWLAPSFGASSDQHCAHEDEPAIGPETVQNNWFTTLPAEAVVSHTPVDQDEVDDVYREGLSNRLKPPPSNDTLPSADFLNLCIKLYFSKFNHVFPLLHEASFRPSSEKSLLLLSVCSVGAIFVGTPSAAAQGRKIFLMLNKAILVSWDNYIRRDGQEVLSVVQAATIGQTFGMLSGYASDLYLTESFHGTVIAWARQGGCFKAKKQPPPSTTARNNTDRGPRGQEEAWRSWVHSDEAMRVMLGLHIHDAEFATTFHHEPLLRHRRKDLPQCCTDELLHAPAMAEWTSKVASADTAHASHMHEYAVLAGIVASIQEERKSPSFTSLIHVFRKRLLDWHADYSVRAKKRSSRAFHVSLMVLWHSAFMHLYTDFDLLEEAVGRDGPAPAEQAKGRVRAWAASSEARRAGLHALVVLRALESWPVGDEPAIHVPKVIFFAGIIVYNYLTLKAIPVIGSDNTSTSPSLLDEDINMPELQISGLLSGPASTPRGTADREKPPVVADLFPLEPSILAGAIDLLHGIGRWGISRKFSSILEALLDDVTLGPQRASTNIRTA